MNEDNIREKTDLELEREELNLLVKQGVRFSVTHKIRRRKKGVKGFFQRPEAVTVKEALELILSQNLIKPQTTDNQVQITT